MISIRDFLRVGHRPSQVIGILLVVVIALITSLDSPEGYEQALESSLASKISLECPDSHSAALEGITEKEALKRAGKRKPKYFDEDYILSWLDPVNFRQAQSGISIDLSNAKYKAFYSRGNLRPRHLLIAKNRDYVNLNIQQYGRSIH